MKNELTAIEQLKLVARNCQEPMLDELVHLDTDIGIFRFVRLTKPGRHILDVPVRHIVSLVRDDFLREPETKKKAPRTWRAAVECLHGTGWTAAIFPYFSGPLYDACFPAPQALGELRLQSYGGAVCVTNGTHRAVAGKAWLSNLIGAGAEFKAVGVLHHPIEADMREVLAGAVARNSDIEFYPVTPEVRGKRIVGDDLLHTVFRFKGDYRLMGITVDTRVIDVPAHKAWFHLEPSSLWRTARWRTLPLAVIKHMLNDAWVRDQIAKKNVDLPKDLS